MFNKQPKFLFIFDIETIPDTEAAFNLTDCKSRDIDIQRKALRDYHLDTTDGNNEFLRQPFHKVIALSYALFNINHLHNDTEEYILRHIGSGGEVEPYCEETLIKNFFEIILSEDKYRYTRLVTFNGRTFDIPVLKYRAMKYGISCKNFYDRMSGVDYQYRYNTNYNCDLLDVLSDFGASARVKLNEVCSILGFPGKFGIEGSQVTNLYDKGNLKAVRDYCETDVLNTFLVYLRYSLHIGRITKETYNSSVKQLINFIEHKSKADHLLEFKKAWIKSSKENILLP